MSTAASSGDAPVPEGDVRVGTCGWSYPTGRGTWNGIFYPSAAERRRTRGFDELRYYAEHFETVEVNSTFYRQPDATMTGTWAARTPPTFDFSVKLFQKFTHARGVGPEAASRRRAGSASAETLPQVSQADVDAFRAGIEPIAASGKIGALLVQFPPSFTGSGPARDYLTWLLQKFRAYPLAVELRHRSWSDSLADTLRLLDDYRAAWVQIDEPKFRFSIRQNYLPNVTGFYYMRLHGRNAEKWWRHERSEDRYDYLYTADELKPFVETARAVRQLVKKAYVYFNNHFAAKSVVDGVVLKQQLEQPITGSYTAEIRSRYPVLDAILPGDQARDARPAADLFG